MANTKDIYTAVPAAPAVGDRHICTDCQVLRIYDGSVWQDWLQGYGIINAARNRAWTPTAGSTLDLGAGVGTPENNLACMYTPQAGDFTANIILSATGDCRPGVGFYDSSSGRSTMIWPNHGAANWAYTRWSTLGVTKSTEAAFLSNSFCRFDGPYVHWTIQLSSGTMSWKANTNGRTPANTLYTESVGTFIGAVDAFCIGWWRTQGSVSAWHVEVT